MSPCLALLPLSLSLSSSRLLAVIQAMEFVHNGPVMVWEESTGQYVSPATGGVLPPKTAAVYFRGMLDGLVSTCDGRRESTEAVGDAFLFCCITQTIGVRIYIYMRMIQWLWFGPSTPPSSTYINMLIYIYLCIKEARVGMYLSRVFIRTWYNSAVQTIFMYLMFDWCIYNALEAIGWAGREVWDLFLFEYLESPNHPCFCFVLTVSHLVLFCFVFFLCALAPCVCCCTAVLLCILFLFLLVEPWCGGGGRNSCTGTTLSIET